MILYIEHKPAAVKNDFSITYTADNVLFSRREDFTLNIELPLHCPENDAIFGMIHRKDADLVNIYLDAEIIAPNFKKSGAVVITAVTDDMVKVQFIAGRSFQNFYPKWNDTYIDLIELPKMPVWRPDNYQSASGGTINNGRKRPGYDEAADDPQLQYVTPAQAWQARDFIALPWCNNTTGNVQNRADRVNSQYVWHAAKDNDDDTEVVTGLSCQIRLYRLVEMICQAMGYTLEAQQWRDSVWYSLYSLNTVPAAWGVTTWNRTLPHWTINQLLEEIEKVLFANFEVDHKNRTVKFCFLKALVEAAESVSLDNILDDFQLDVTKDDESGYVTAGNVGYAAQDHEMWNLYSCYWAFRNDYFPIYRYQTTQLMIDAVNNNNVYGTGGSVRNRGAASAQAVLYAEDIDTYFVVYVVARVKTGGTINGEDAYESAYTLVQLNSFGDHITDQEDWQNVEQINIVPAWLDDTTYSDNYDRHLGKIIFLELGDTENTSASGEEYSYFRTPSTTQVPLSTILQSSLVDHLQNKDFDKEAYVFNSMAVGFWFGDTTPFEPELPRPWIDFFDSKVRWSVVHQKLVVNNTIITSGHNASLRINNTAYGTGSDRLHTPKIDTRKKYEFSFLCEGMPDTKSVFVIRGKKYLCSQLRAEIDQNGMSQLKKGTFWRIL